MDYIREDWTLFRTVETLSQKAGISPVHLRRLIVKELADNALDAGARCNVGTLQNGTVVVRDDGPGIPGTPEQIAKLFSVRRPLMSSKLVRLPTRGALGNGLRVVAGAVLASNGELTVTTNGRCLKLTPQDTGETKVTVIADNLETKGTCIDILLGPAVPADNNCLAWARQAIQMARGDTYKGKTSAHWYGGDAFWQLLQASQARTVREVVAELDGCSGGKAGGIAANFLSRAPNSLSRDEAIELLCAARNASKPVLPERLGAIGPDFLDGFAYCKSAGMYQASNGAHDGIQTRIPCVLEIWAKVTAEGEDGLGFYVNRTPITGEMSFARQSKKTELCIYGCNLGYGFEVGKYPVQLVVNIQTPHMPITTDGKAPDLERFLDPLREGIAKAAQKAKKLAAPDLPKRGDVKRATLANLDTAIAKASGDGQYRYSQRQLFYSIREDVKAVTGTELQWETFLGIITDYEAVHGNLPGMYRDPRGTLYHPHLRREIPLGTIAVENYNRPAWTFNKILYIEKEGFSSILQSVNWPERNDCAILCSKGYSTRAVRDVVDLLGETGEEILFFCVHDADAAGTMIYQTLQGGTKARAARKVRIVNLGLEPDEARRMGLQVERVIRTDKKKRAAVAEYVPKADAQWLQTNRVELNAMTTREFLDWLDGKMAEHGQGKLIPPGEVMENQLREDIQERLRDQLTERILADAGLDLQVSEAYERMEEGVAAEVAQIQEYVREELEREPVARWAEPVADLAGVLVELHLTYSEE